MLHAFTPNVMCFSGNQTHFLNSNRALNFRPASTDKVQMKLSINQRDVNLKHLKIDNAIYTNRSFALHSHFGDSLKMS